MIQKSKTIVTEDQLEKQAKHHAVASDAPFAVTDTKISQEQTPQVEGGYPIQQYPKASEQNLQEIGSAEAQKESAKNSVLNVNKFDQLVQKNSSRILLKIKTAKLLDFFPDEVVIETTKVNVSLRDYFFIRRIHTISIEDVEDVFVETTPLYATLKIVDKGFVENVVQIQFLKKNDAKRARRVIQGLVTAYKEGVDVSSLPDEGLIHKLEVLGSAGDVEHVASVETPVLP